MEKLRLKERDKETISSYDQLIAEFLRISAKIYPEEIIDLDLLRFCQSQRARGLAERTIYNQFAHIRAFLRSCGVDIKKLLPDKKDRPQKNDPLPEAYTQQEVERFLAACNSTRDRLVFEFFLKTGVREKELAYSEWSDVRWTEGVLLVQSKPHYGFRTKTGKSRKITLESGLLEKLAEWQCSRPKTRFIFGTRSDKPNGHFLEACKRTAHRAGLNCGHCAPCLEKDECERWYLHKWRATFATWFLRGGVDIRTVQLALGHTKIEMTERYLAPAEGPAAQAKVNAVFAGLNTGQQPNVAVTADSARLSPSRLAVRRQEALPEEAAGVAASVGD
jgi:integrase